MQMYLHGKQHLTQADRHGSQPRQRDSADKRNAGTRNQRNQIRHELRLDTKKSKRNAEKNVEKPKPASLIELAVIMKTTRNSSGDTSNQKGKITRPAHFSKTTAIDFRTTQKSKQTF